MKIAFIAIFILSTPLLSLSDDVEGPCFSRLLESYDISGSEHILPYNNRLCPLAKFNCCSYKAQLDIYKKWVVAHERKKIIDIYKEFENAYSNIFDTFVKIEGLAQVAYENTIDIPKSNCNKIADTILKFKVSSLKDQVVASAKKFYKFLYESRRGFYCAICDQRTHKYFNLKAEELMINQNFCSQMVKNTMNYALFRFVHFMKISRLYAEFLTKCDLDGKYYPHRYLKHSIKFFRRNEITMEVNDCKKGLKSEESFRFCSSYCTRFNPVKYDQYFEGELDKLFSYEKTLTSMADQAHEKYENDSADKPLDISNPQHKRRILSEGKSKNKADVKKQDETVNEISKFNEEFKTALIRPITYSFEEDLTIKHIINFDESILSQGLDKVFDIMKFKFIMKPKGIDFHAYGKSASINKDSAIDAFTKLNPANKMDKAEFDKIMKSL